MTLSEFKAWFEGFTENLDGAPSEKQFKKIKDKVSEITGTPISYPVYIERYHDYFQRWPYWTSGGIGIGTGTRTYSSNMAMAGNAQVSLTSMQAAEAFDSHAAMYALGKAESVN